MLRLLIPLLLLAPAAWACDFPDSERASAPEWLCGEHQYEGAFHTAVGSKTRMPSISLQNRLAGRDAVSGVLRALFTDAVEKLTNNLMAPPPSFQRKKKGKTIRYEDNICTARAHFTHPLPVQKKKATIMDGTQGSDSYSKFLGTQLWSQVPTPRN